MIKPFKALSIFNVTPGWSPTETQLADRAFRPCGPLEASSAGWAPIRDDRRVLRLGDHVLLAWETEAKVVPPDTVKRKVEDECARIMQETGEVATRGLKKKIQLQVIDAMMPVAFTTRSTVGVWIDTKTGTLALDTATAPKAETILAAIRDAAKGDAQLGYRDWDASTHMRNWLADTAAPWPFTVAAGCRLSFDGQSVSYRNRDLEGEDVQMQLAGLGVDRLDLRFADRIAFTLRANGALSGIDIGDYDLDENDDPHDANLALMAGEYGPLIAALDTALTAQEIS